MIPQRFLTKLDLTAIAENYFVITHQPEKMEKQFPTMTDEEHEKAEMNRKEMNKLLIDGIKIMPSNYFFHMLLMKKHLYLLLKIFLEKLLAKIIEKLLIKRKKIQKLHPIGFNFHMISGKNCFSCGQQKHSRNYYFLQNFIFYCFRYYFRYSWCYC